MHKKDPNLEMAKSIADDCYRGRRRLSYTMADIAQGSAMSVRMIVRLENPAQLAVVIKKAKTSRRQSLALASTLIRVARVLGIVEEHWLRKVSLNLSPKALKAVRDKALMKQGVATQNIIPEVTCPLAVFHVLSGVPSETIILPVDLARVIQASIGSDYQIVDETLLLQKLADRAKVRKKH